MSVNKSWWKSRVAELGISQRELAIKHLNLDAASLSKTLNGMRRLQLSEANRLAELFKTNVEEVMFNFNIQDHHASMTSPLLGYFDLSGAMTPLVDGVTFERAGQSLGKTFVLQYRVGVPSVIDGWLFYFFDREQAPDTNVPALFNLEDGRRIVGSANKGYVPNEYRILNLTTGETLATAKIKSMQLLAAVVPPNISI